VQATGAADAYSLGQMLLALLLGIFLFLGTWGLACTWRCARRRLGRSRVEPARTKRRANRRPAKKQYTKTGGTQADDEDDEDEDPDNLIELSSPGTPSKAKLFP